jgi:hypothetical protein
MADNERRKNSEPPNRIRQAYPEWLAELTSQLRWGWVYWLPKMLAKPLRARVVQVGYGAALGVSFFLILIGSPYFWGDFLRNIVNDVWTKFIGAASAQQGLDWLASIYPRTVFAGLLAWGGAARLWAEPRSRFLEAIEEDIGLPILRGAGSRLHFCERVNPALRQTLALGPAGRILPEYTPLPEYTAMLQAARTMGANRFPRGVLISGPSGLGKTRTALELTADLKPAMVVVWNPVGTERESLPKIPRWDGFFTILADSLPFEATAGQTDLPVHLQHLLQRCPRALVIATIREEYLPPDVRSLQVFEIKKEQGPERYARLAEEIRQAEEAVLGHRVPIEEVLQRFDGYPGSLVVGAELMRAQYELLAEAERGFLQAARVLRELGMRRLTTGRIWGGYADLFGDPPNPLQREAIVRTLAKKGFLTLGEAN